MAQCAPPTARRFRFAEGKPLVASQTRAQSLCPFGPERKTDQFIYFGGGPLLRTNFFTVESPVMAVRAGPLAAIFSLRDANSCVVRQAAARKERSTRKAAPLPASGAADTATHGGQLGVASQTKQNAAPERNFGKIGRPAAVSRRNTEQGERRRSRST